jgi:hypothetical protein
VKTPNKITELICKLHPFIKQSLAVKLAVYLGLSDTEEDAATSEIALRTAIGSIKVLYSKYFCQTVAGNTQRDVAFALDKLKPQRECMAWSNAMAKPIITSITKVIPTYFVCH